MYLFFCLSLAMNQGKEKMTSMQSKRTVATRKKGGSVQFEMTDFDSRSVSLFFSCPLQFIIIISNQGQAPDYAVPNYDGQRSACLF